MKKTGHNLPLSVGRPRAGLRLEWTQYLPSAWCLMPVRGHDPNNIRHGTNFHPLCVKAIMSSHSFIHSFIHSSPLVGEYQAGGKEVVNGAEGMCREVNWETLMGWAAGPPTKEA